MFLIRTLLHAPAAAPHHPLPLAPPWLLQTSGLAGQRGERLLFQQLSLALAPGSVTWLRGTNGRGKTSLLRILAGLSTPQAGQLQVAAGGVLYLGHQNALKDDLSAAEALAFLAQLHGLPAAAGTVTQALRRMGVAGRPQAPVRTLSQGQRRRVALARLVLSRSVPLWLLDEPFDALDAVGIQTLNSVISEHTGAGGAVLLTSHQPLTLAHPLPVELDLEPYAPR